MLGAVLGRQGIVLGKTLWAQFALVDGMMRITADANGTALFDSDEHPATHRTVAARGRYPVIRNFLCRRMANHRVRAVRIFFGKDVQAEFPLQRLLHVHAAFSPAA